MLGLRLLKGAALGRLRRGHFWSRRAYELAYAFNERLSMTEPSGALASCA